MFIAYIHLSLCYTDLAFFFLLAGTSFLLLKFNFLQISKMHLKLSVSGQYLIGGCLLFIIKTK